MDDVTEAPIDRLRTAVTCQDADTAHTAFQDFGGADLQALGTELALLHGFVGLEPDADGPDILLTVSPAVDVWLEVAEAELGSSVPALQAVLRDVGLGSARELPTFAGRLSTLVALSSPAVLGPLLTAADAAAAEVCLDDDVTVALLRRAWPAASAFEVLPILATQGDLALAVAQGSPSALGWFTVLPVPLSTAILGWGTGAAWVRALWALGADFTVLAMVMANPAGWAPVFRDMLLAPTPEDVAHFAFPSPLALFVLEAIATISPGDAGASALRLGWTPLQVLTIATMGGWLNAEAARAVFSGPGATLDTQAAAAQDPVNIAMLQIVGGLYPLDVFPLLAADSARVATVYRTNLLFALWMNTDFTKLKAHVRAGAAWAAWAAALVLPMHVPILLRLAKDNGDDWRAAVDGVNGFAAVLATAPSPMADDETYRGFFNLWGDGTGRTGAQATLAFSKLAGARIMPAGEETIFDDTSNLSDANNVGSANRWNVRAVWMPVAPTDAAMLEMMRMLRPMTRNEVSATRNLGFVSVKEYRWWQTAPVASNSWHKWVPNQTRSLGTSYAWGGNVIMFKPSGAEAGAAQGMDTTLGDSDSLGTSRMVGGGEKHGTNDQRTLGADTLTYFQNHARHEFGHSVGASQYPGMATTGDAAAQTWGGWAKEAPGAFQTAMWSASANVNVRIGSPPVTVSVPAADVASWAINILQGGAEPSAGNILVTDPAFAGQLVSAKVTALNATTFKNQALMKYLTAVLSGGEAAGAPDNGYQFTGYTPTGDVHMYASRFDGSFAKYSKGAYDALIKTHGWYSLSSPAEMFAEIYTKRYSGKPTPGALNGVDWTAFFTQLEAAGPASTPTGPGAQATDPNASTAPTGQTAGTAAIAGESTPPPSIIP